MGLGKTIQAISLIISHPHPMKSLIMDPPDDPPNLPSNLHHGTLVVAPLALIRQWEGELKNRTDRAQLSRDLRVCVHHGPGRAKDARSLRRYDVVITTYQVLVSEYSSTTDENKVGCFGIRWWRLILDEAHSIKNKSTKGAQAACALRARYRWALTGTPVQNNLDELQSLIKFLRIEPFDNIAVWKEKIDSPMKQGREALALQRLGALMSVIMLRRTKEVLMKDQDIQDGKLEGSDECSNHERANSNLSQMRLPERHVKSVVCQFNSQEKAFYEKLEARTEQSLEELLGKNFSGEGPKLNMTSALVLLLRLRQACNHPLLAAGKINRDKEAFVGVGSQPGGTRSKKKEGLDKEVDDIADMMGSLSVEAMKCETCLLSLTREEGQRGETKCKECKEDLEMVQLPNPAEKGHTPKKKERRNRRRISDSEDDDDERGNCPLEPEAVGFRGTQGGKGSHMEPPTGNSGSGDPCEDIYDSRGNRLAISTKIKYLLEILRNEKQDNKKVIVFSQFTSMLDLIEPFLHREGMVFTRYDGSMRNDVREASLTRLRESKQGKNWCGVLLCSLKCGALGLNLTAASRVVLLEPFWNPVCTSPKWSFVLH